MLMNHSAESSDDFATVLGQAEAGEAAAWRQLFHVVSGPVVAFLVSRGAEVHSFTPRKLSLEELFIRIFGTEGSL